MTAKRLGTALLPIALLSCGPLLRGALDSGDPAFEKQVEEYRYGPDGYVVEGEVRDFATFALAGDAVIETSSDVSGYQPKAHVDDRGHFSVAIVVRQERNDFWQGLFGALAFDDERSGEHKVRKVAFRARSGRRCSPVFRSRVDDLPQGPMVLWLQECTEKELARLP